MTIIYEPKGRAREYAGLAINVYTGCDHACTYCYAPDATFKSRSQFIEPKTRIGFLEALEKEAGQLARAGQPAHQILLSFTCDPYQHFDETHKITRQALEILRRHNLSFCTLTKGGTLALRDIDLFGPGDCFASTLTFCDPADSVRWEPRAAIPRLRLQALKEFHKTGIETWVSLEPVIDPAQTLALIDAAAPFVDLFKVGKLNHHPLAGTIDWHGFGRRAIELLERLDKKYYIKDDLRVLIPASALNGPNRLTQQQIEQAHKSTPKAQPAQAAMF